MHRGTLGAGNLNNHLQETLDPGEGGLAASARFEHQAARDRAHLGGAEEGSTVGVQGEEPTRTRGECPREESGDRRPEGYG